MASGAGDGSSPDGPSADATSRSESVEERLDRNFDDLLQELRVLQTGTQILAGFLLTLPFQARFEELTAYHRSLFLWAIGLAIFTTVLLVAPVSVHRMLFRRHRKEVLVSASHRLARVGLFTLGLTMATVLCLMVSVVVGDGAGALAAAAAVVVFVLLWWGLPAWLRAQSNGAESPAP